MVTSWESITKVFPLQEERLAGSPLRMWPRFHSSGYPVNRELYCLGKLAMATNLDNAHS